MSFLGVFELGQHLVDHGSEFIYAHVIEGLLCIAIDGGCMRSGVLGELGSPLDPVSTGEVPIVSATVREKMRHSARHCQVFMFLFIFIVKFKLISGYLSKIAITKKSLFEDLNEFNRFSYMFCMLLNFLRVIFRKS